MYRVVAAAVAVILCAAPAAGGAEPRELRLATFQETAQVLVDKTLSDGVTAAITLQSTSSQEIKIPGDLNRKILDNPRIVSVVLTNQEGCGVLGVAGQSCILVNVERAGEDTNIVKVQQAAKANGDTVIGDLNGLFDTDASYHSSYLHHRDEINVMLGTSGAVSGRDVVSAVYTMPKEDTGSMYRKMAALTLDKRIRDSGGFLDVARSLAAHENAHMALSIIPDHRMTEASSTLFQLRVSSEYPGAWDGGRINPLDYLQADRIERSGYFAGGFYPLNSVVQIVVLSPEGIELHDAGAGMIPTRQVGGEAVPTELAESGWVFDATSGAKIEGKYLFGERESAGEGDLLLVFGPAGGAPGAAQAAWPAWIDGSVAAAVIIAAAAAAAAGFFLRGYRPKGGG